ncbi:MAG: hypothetical protein ABGW84_01745 [Sphingomonadaceae bacterium]|jgi:hypothetical protein
MEVKAAQAELRHAYTDGGPGVVVSGLIWLAAAFVERQQGVEAAFLALFFGGMLIFPFALLINRAILKRRGESKTNPFGKLVLEGTIAMIGGLIAAWLFLPFKPEWVIPLAAIAVGTHYFAFRTAYGLAIFWLLGAAVTALGALAIFTGWLETNFVTVAVAVTELVFGGILWLRAGNTSE